jgi:hypothetical protein
MLCLLAVLLLFAGLFPLPGVGLRRTKARNTVKETYGSVWLPGSSAKQNLLGESKIVGKSISLRWIWPPSRGTPGMHPPIHGGEC